MERTILLISTNGEEYRSVSSDEAGWLCELGTYRLATPQEQNRYREHVRRDAELRESQKPERERA